MITPVSHETWQILRHVLRAEPGPVPGRDLRIRPTRKNKDGSFLDDLVGEGLLVADGEVPMPRPPARAWERPEPVQFRRRYRLTDLGRHAAEYGEYERAFVPKPQDVTGTAAELLKLLEKRAYLKATFGRKPAKTKPTKIKTTGR